MRLLWFELAECDALALIGCASASIDKWWVESVHIEMQVVYEKALAYSHIAISISIAIEPNRNRVSRILGGDLLDLVGEQCALVADEDGAFISEDGRHVPILLSLELGE
jgi:hypothetical protein